MQKMEEMDAVYIDNVELTLISLPFKPQTKDELQIAVDLWETIMHPL